MLEQITVAQTFAYLLVFARIGAALALLPGFSAAYVTVRVRLIFALALTLVVQPVVSHTLPALPDSPAALALLVAAEVTVGISGFLGTVGLVLIFVSDLHHLMLRAIVGSYDRFPAGAMLPTDGFAEAATAAVAASMVIGLQLSAPFLVVALVYNVGLGLLGRLMPQLPVFFFGMPIQISFQIWAMALTISGIMLVFLNQFREALSPFAGP